MDGTFLTALSEQLQPGHLLTGEAVRERYYHIWRMQDPLQARAVLLPTSTQEVSEILRLCHAHRQPVVVHGGRTNLVGSTETAVEEVVISLEKMNTIEEVDTKGRTMTVQAGVILEDVQSTAREQGMLFPLNFGAKGSAQMGGIISTNAGGLRVFRFGMTRNLILGLEAVTADGTIISSMKKIIKDNSAYDLKHLFIGSEGTLGIVTRAVLKLIEAPASRTSAFAGLDTYDQVVEFLKFMDRGLAGTLSGFELMWKPVYQVFTTPPATVPPPIPYDYPFYVLLESMGSNQAEDQQKLETLLADALDQQLIQEAVPAQSGSDIDWFWTIREDVHHMVAQCNHEQQFDISLPIALIGDYIQQTVDKLYEIPEVEKVFTFGHVADGNIHIVVGKSTQNQSLINRINDTIYNPLQALGGSVSAEHGIGTHKKAYLPLSRSEAEIQLMRTMKQALDPRGILNRGKVIDVN